MLRVHMYVILSCMYRILCRRLTEYLLVMSERALETVIGAFAVTRSAEDISNGYRITLPWILMRSSWKRLYPRGAVMPRKRVAAFSVYKRQQLRDEEDGPLDSSVTDSAASVGGATSSTAEENMEGGSRGLRTEEGATRKRKKETMGRLSPKKRKMDNSQESETIERGERVSGKRIRGVKKKISKQRGDKKGIIKPSKKKRIMKKKLIKRERVDEGGEEDKAPSADSGDEASSLKPLPASPKHLEVHSVDGADMLVPFFTQFDPDSHEDSRNAGRELFRLLINPFPLDDFFNKIWEQRPLFLSRHKPQYNNGWFSTKQLDSILRENSVEFTTNIDITSYQDGERETHNPDGRAVSQVVWDFFQEGCSVRLLNPQTYSKSMWLLVATLQEYFQSFVGANVYLTPAGTQGFAPHSDDIEAFILQLEGKKHWKLYSPREESEVLPRFSSPNMHQEELGEPILDVVLEPGDLLYFPRGTYHQAESLPESHSLHVTLSTYQKYTWGDVMAKLMSSTVELAMLEDVGLRRGLPLGCLNYMGRHNSNTDDPRRVEFLSKIEEIMENLIHYVPIDDIMDQIARENVHSSLPPCLTEGEKRYSVAVRGSEWSDENGVGKGFEFTGETEVKLVRYNAVRLVTDSEGHTLFYNHQNSRVFQEKNLQGIPLDSHDAQVIEKLLQHYPNYTKIQELTDYEAVAIEEVELFHTLYSHSIILAR